MMFQIRGSTGWITGVCLWFAGCLCHAVPAFPGAEGAGAETVGGRGGDVYFVTNTNNTGAGSLRNGISTATGPRTIIFRVSGNIDLTSTLAINKRNLTIAGQTAPGDGITLRRRTVSVQDTRDVIIRYLRCRAGDMDSAFQDDSFHVVNGTNIMVDHVSSSWSVDECLSVTHSTNVTVQWCMISESLKNSQHDKGSHGYGTLLRYGSGELTIHHNLYQHHDSRNPRLGDNIKLDFVNNVLYNWGGRAGYSGNSADLADNPGGFTNYLNYVNNYLVAGPSSSSPNTAFASGATTTFIYLSGNRIDANKNLLLDGADTGTGMLNPYPYTPMANRYPLPSVNTDSAATAYQRVLAFVGASGVRDQVDHRLIGTVRNHTGRLIDAVGPVDQATDYVTNNINGTNYVFVRGWPVLNAATPPVDSDNDGIPNYFETAFNWNPSIANNNHTNSDGYTDLEWHLNWLADPHAVTAFNQPVNVDLRLLTGSNANLAFNNLSATNGSVTLLPDGYTAQFLPGTNLVGFARFDFNVTNLTDRASFGPVPVVVLVTNVAPAILVQPTSQTNEAGLSASFTVQAAGGFLAYRWRKDGVNLTDSPAISGATNATLNLTNVSGGNAGSYSVVITNYLGAITSSIVTLTVVSNTPPSLAPIPNQTLIAGATLLFTNSATDPDAGQTLSFTLLNAPSGAAIGSSNGVFLWRPLVAQSGSSNSIGIVVADNGSPSLSATQFFTAFVIRPIEPQARIFATNSQFALSVEGDAGPDFTIQASTNLWDWTAVFSTNSPGLPFLWLDPDAAEAGNRFYRILLGP